MPVRDVMPVVISQRWPLLLWVVALFGFLQRELQFRRLRRSLGRRERVSLESRRPVVKSTRAAPRTRNRFRDLQSRRAGHLPRVMLLRP